MRKFLALLSIIALGLTGLATSVAATPEPPPPAEVSGLDLVDANVSLATLGELRNAGIDVVSTGVASDGLVGVQIIAGASELRLLSKLGVQLTSIVDKSAAANGATPSGDSAFGHEIWRSYSEAGGIRDQVMEIVAAHPDIASLHVIGQTTNGQDIVAVRVTRDPDASALGEKPTVLHISAQHAREWISPEVTMRTLKYYVDNYDTTPEIRRQLRDVEVWFVPVANPDGYDFTFSNERLWRKNLRDNNNDGVIESGDGVDLNRNWNHRWGYDDEGSSANPASETYRGPSGNSEPETQALDSLFAAITPEFLVNWHSAAELLLYGTGWQVATPTPNDNISIALSGDDETPAIPGYDPDLSAELYTTNGETTEHAEAVYQMIGFTPELDTCDSAEAIFPDDDYGDSYCEDNGRSGFEFPDDEALIQSVFEKNLPFALSMADSAPDPGDPVSAIGWKAPKFNINPFPSSYDDSQVISVEARDEYTQLRLAYRINNGPLRYRPMSEWTGGERYGGEGTFYREYRGEVTRAKAGDKVRVYVQARIKRPGVPSMRIISQNFTYRVKTTNPADVLIIADENYEGVSPRQPGVTAPLYTGVYADALAANGLSSDVWDVSADGAPHDLGVLSHYDLIIWEKGDNRLTADEEDEFTSLPLGTVPNAAVSETEQYLTIAIRDYLNEGGKVIHSGEFAAYFGEYGSSLGGVYYALNGDESAKCVVVEAYFSECLLLSDDFAQYYQGVYGRQTQANPEAIASSIGLLSQTYEIDGSMTPESGSFLVTSDFYSVTDHPDFTSYSLAEYITTGPSAYDPFEGDGYVAILHGDDVWSRLTREIDLTGATSAEVGMKLSFDTELGYDNLILEAREVGSDDWTTLPDLNGATSTTPPSECEAGFYADGHPFLLSYLTIADPCLSTGTTGDWNAFTGSSGGWSDVAFDLSAYVGKNVEVSISYVSDPGSGGIGAFVDNAYVTIDATTDVEGFEAGLGDWSVTGPPPGSDPNQSEWVQGGAVLAPPSAIVATPNTVTLGFGFEAIRTADERAALMGDFISSLFR